MNSLHLHILAGPGATKRKPAYNCGPDSDGCNVRLRDNHLSTRHIGSMDAPADAILPRAFYRRDSREVAPDLLNKILLGPDGCRGRIVETEAYCGAVDEAAHTFRGKTARNATMFGPPGHLYVYFTYGMHWCANTACGDEGVGIGVLLRAVQPLSGLEQMRERRPRAKNERELCSGPARLCQAFDISGADDGTDLLTGRFRIASDGMVPPTDPVVTPRVGISRAIDAPWRWYVADNRYVSKR